MWFKKFNISYLTKPGSTTENLRVKVKNEHAKVEQNLDASIDHLNALLDDTINVINKNGHSHK